MEAEQKQKKILFAGLTILVLAGVFLYSTSLLERNTPVIQTTEPQSLVPTEVKPEAAAVVEAARVSTLDWKKVQFDACGGKDKYSSLPWWDKFMAHAEKVDYYDDAYVWSAIKSVNESTYENPEKIVFNHDTLCASSHGDGSPICVGRYKKLTAASFDEYGEGCLSKDGKGFVAVFPGEYLGGGNHIFRYDIPEDAFEEADKINETTPDDHAWAAPPRKFGKRYGNIIKMTGGGGDAGWVMRSDYDYDFAANTVRIMKVCLSYDRETPDCRSF